MSCCVGDASKKIFIKKKIEKDGAKWNNRVEINIR